MTFFESIRTKLTAQKRYYPNLPCHCLSMRDSQISHSYFDKSAVTIVCFLFGLVQKLNKTISTTNHKL